MRTVDEILEQVYGSGAEAASALGVLKTAPYNWKKWGHFPARIAIQIFMEAKRKRIALSLAEIPTLENKAAAS